VEAVLFFAAVSPLPLSCAVAFVPQVWKPFSSSYQYAVKQLGVSAERVCMVASHPWDIAGAMQVPPASP
jgi:HAD superfamily hydrolase (TIGR01493 family)